MVLTRGREHAPRRAATTFRRLSPVLLALLAALTACRERPSGGGAAAPSVRRYTVRGEVVKLPDPGAKPAQLSLRHEAIPDFADSSGAVVGMAPMVMPFDVAPGVALEGLRAGDKVEVTLAVDWSRPSLLVEGLRKLPDDTALDLGGPGARSKH